MPFMRLSISRARFIKYPSRPSSQAIRNCRPLIVTLTRDIARGNLSWAVMRSWQYPFLIIVCFEITALPASGGGLLARPVCQCSPLSAAHGKTGGPALQCGPAGFHVPQRDGIVLGQVRSGHDSWSSRNPSAVDPIEFVIVF